MRIMPDRSGDAGELIRQHVRRILSQLRALRDKRRDKNPKPTDPIDKRVEVNRENDASSGGAGNLKRPS
jgi:hypothetical protein